MMETEDQPDPRQPHRDPRVWVLSISVGRRVTVVDWAASAPRWLRQANTTRASSQTILTAPPICGTILAHSDVAGSWEAGQPESWVRRCSDR